MRPRPFLLLIALMATLFLVVFGAGEAEEEQEEWETEVKGPLWSYTFGNDVISVAFSANDEFLVAGSWDGNVSLFNKYSNEPVWSYNLGYEDNNISRPRNVNSVDISADGNYIVVAAGDYDSVLHLFNKDSNIPLWTNNTNRCYVPREGLAISDDGEHIVLGTDCFLYFFNKDSNSAQWSYDTGEETRAWVSSVDISANGDFIVVGTYGGNFPKLYLFGKDNNTPLWKIDYEVESVSITPDGEYITTGGMLFRNGSSTPLWGSGGSEEVAISADGQYIVRSSFNGWTGTSNVNVVNKDGYTLWYYTVESSAKVDISADGEYIVIGAENKLSYFSIDSSTPIWNYTTSEYVENYTAMEYVTSIAITGNGDYVAVGYGSTGTAAVELCLFSSDQWPDLYPASISFSNDNPAVGETVTISTVVKLLGESTSQDFNVTFYLDSISKANEIQSITIDGQDMVPGIENEYPVSIEWKADIGGTHTIFVVVDSANAIGELEEGNELSKVIQIGLVVSETDTDNETNSEESKLYEGDDAGECSDEADNDKDGLFDCDDEGCAGSPACKATDSGGGIPSISLIPALISIGLIAIFRRKQTTTL